MPKVSQFYGIKICLYAKEHGVSHFHAKYQGSEVSISIKTLEVLEGHIPGRALSLVIEWAIAHRAELQAGWDALQNEELPKNIAPLN